MMCLTQRLSSWHSDPLWVIVLGTGSLFPIQISTVINSRVTSPNTPIILPSESFNYKSSYMHKKHNFILFLFNYYETIT